jgi:phosphatidylinositol glycan class O
MALYRKEFARAYPHELFNVADLDDCDDITMRDIKKEMAFNNFTMLIAHIIGTDHAGHYYLNVAHPEMERKILNAEAMIQKVINQIDNETVMIVFGDHGTTDSGGHGGETSGELRTIMSAYSKGGPPIKAHKNPDVRKTFNTLQSHVKQLDMPSILAAILDLEISFSNLGVLHPYLYTNKNGGMRGLYGRMVKQIESLDTYTNEYCMQL